MKGYMYAHLHSFHPLLFPVLLLLVTAAYSFSSPSVFFIYMYALCVPVFLRCQSVCEGRGSFILVLKV